MKEELAANLRRIRTEQGLSVQALARISGIARATLIALENGEANPTLETLMSVGEALSVPAAILLARQSLDVQLIGANEGEIPEEEFGEVRILDQLSGIASLSILEGHINKGSGILTGGAG